MSSFQDNFKKDSQEEEDMLEYDDSAFYYFSLSLLTAFLVPWTLSILYKIIWGGDDIAILENSCKCSRCTALLNVKRKEARAKVFNRGLYFNIIVLAFLWYLWYIIFNVVISLDTL